MANTSGLRRKIWVAFILQMTAISFAAVLGVYAAATVIEDVLVKRILKHDAEYFLDLAATDPSTPPPNTYFVRGYLARPGGDAEAVPESFRSLAPGYHRANAPTSIVYVADSAEGRL
jgi:hypothetical protein